MAKKKKDMKFNFIKFKEQFLLALKEVSVTCVSFCGKIEQAKDVNEIRNVFIRNREDVGEWLGLDLNPDCENCERMERNAYILQEKLEPYEELMQSVADEYKLKAFIGHRNDFSADELETLFHNGKTLLEMLKKTEK